MPGPAPAPARRPTPADAGALVRGRARALSGRPWRAVEAQHRNSTRALVDSDEEQEQLERMIDAVKPPLPDDPALSGLHYLLTTPFRYPPLRHGSRFGSRAERGIWYGSESKRALFAEVAYYRLLFLEGTEADIRRVDVELTAFRVPVRTRRGLDLTVGAFREVEPRVSSPVDYSWGQAVGAAMREERIEAFRYRSARDRERGTHIGVISPAAFASRQPSGLETWRCIATRSRVELSRLDYLRKASFTFGRGEFEVDGRLPAPAL